jgi:epsilon-lactone hydrolase
MSSQRTTRHARPKRNVPIPQSISPEAQAVIAAGQAPITELPSIDDKDSWREIVAAGDQQILDMLRTAVPAGIDSTKREIDGVTCYEAAPTGQGSDTSIIYLDLHGGAFISCGGECCRILSMMTAADLRMRVLAVDYRMPPDHPFPTGLLDALRVYRALLADRSSHQIIVGGTSAGGNLAAALVLKARDEGLPLPAGLVLLTPEVDLTESGDTFATNLGLDAVLPQSLMPANLLYAGDHDLRDPYVSPLFADYTGDFPPVVLTSGTRDVFLSNTVLLHRALRRAGVAAELHIVEAASHGGFGRSTPEHEDIQEEIRGFIERVA